MALASSAVTDELKFTVYTMFAALIRTHNRSAHNKVAPKTLLPMAHFCFMCLPLYISSKWLYVSFCLCAIIAIRNGHEAHHVALLGILLDKRPVVANKH
jgi:hypothetical protein